MSAIFHLAMRDLKKHWWIMVVLIGLFSLLFGAYITLLSHYKSTIQTYTNVIQNFLVVGNSDGLGEIHGSRMTPAIKEMLLDMGYTDPIPEIHQIVGTNFANGTLLKGIRLEDYQKYNSYSLLKGRSLVAGDPPRLAMIGEILANTQDLQIDNDILLRGRKFKVIGIFKTGSVQDNEAWISLEDAQALLNYDRDVSLYLIPDNGQLKAGDLLTDDVLVSQRGETGGFVNSSIRNYLNNYAALGILSGIATIITLANILYRLAQLRRREFGILKSIGFGFNGLAAYFFTQAGILVISGLAGGILFAILIVKTMMTSLSVFGFGVSVGIDLNVLSSITLIVAGFFFICAFIPLIGIYRESIPELVGRN
jgi:ABC-type antimicrobial peptide transport system permease subunit